jgi:glycosyltransferase involved in cell wall biosynthesis
MAAPLGTVDRSAASAFGQKFATKKHVVFVVNTDRFFLTHRASWASALQSSGAKVTVVAEDTGYQDQIRKLGFEYFPLAMGRESITIREGITASLRLFLLLIRIRPSVVFLIATAAYSLGWPAACFLPKSTFYRVITGAGRALASESTSSKIVITSLSASRRLSNVYSLFQLHTDFETFTSRGLATAARSRVIAGTGLDTNVWTAKERAVNSVPVVLFAARLFREKGIYDFIDLAKGSASETARFVVVGKPDRGVVSSVTDDELAAWQADGTIEYWGQSDDMVSVYRAADILVLPSTHPEGTPRVLIEAAACGVVAIASDQPGCREVVRHGETGLIADVDEHGSFDRCLQMLLNEPELTTRMGQRASAFAAEKFSLGTTLTQLYDFIGIED